MPTRIVVGCCLVLLLAAGCASTGVELKPAHPYGADIADRSYAWHQVRFKWRWPEGQAPRWPLDLVAAHRIISPLITEHGASLPLWRFHRRAAPDAAGHQFSFLFYGPDDVAGRIEEAVLDDALTRRLLEEQLLEKVYFTEPDRADRLPATSDARWPDALQSTWPMFIMGVSQTWLGLVETHAADIRLPEQDLAAGMDRYAQVNDKVNEVWGEYAQHAFFHHLSAVFGYQPMVLRKRMRF